MEKCLQKNVYSRECFLGMVNTVELQFEVRERGAIYAPSTKTQRQFQALSLISADQEITAR